MVEKGLGWIPDPPDFRDFTPEHRTIGPLIQEQLPRVAAAVENPAEESLPASVDLRQWCPPVEDQRTLNSCTANAGVGLVEYFQRRAFQKHTDASRLFLYKITRNLLRWPRDEGAYLRTTAAALTLFGLTIFQTRPRSGSISCCASSSLLSWVRTERKEDCSG